MGLKATIPSKDRESPGWQPQGRKALGMVWLPDLTAGGRDLRADCGSKWVFVLGVAAMLIGGCRQPLQHQADPVQVIVEGDGEFPNSLAGRWKARQHGWEFQIEPNGRISSAILGLGHVRVVPGTTTTRPTKSGSQAVFTPGPWTVHYVPSTRELTVRITMDHVRVEMAGNLLEGSSTDTFVGSVAPTNRTWQTQWTTFARYVAHTPDGAATDLSTDPTYGETKTLVFDRADPVSP